MKVLGTHICLHGEMVDVLKDFGYKGHHNQFRIICKCKSMADANRKCEAAGISGKVFRSNFCCETGNIKELSICEITDIAIRIDSIGNNYVTIEQVNDILNKGIRGKR